MSTISEIKEEKDKEGGGFYVVEGKILITFQKSHFNKTFIYKITKLLC